MSQITKARPRAILQGIRDLSRRTPPVAPEQIPQHLPHVYLFTERGPTLPHLVVGASRTKTYGARSFDYLGPYANHATVLANIVNARGNAAMIQRLKPADAATAMLRLSIEVIREELTEYARDEVTGKVKVDTQGYPIELDAVGEEIDRKHPDFIDPITEVFSQALYDAVPRSTIIGYKARWLLDTVREFGEGVVVSNGDMTSSIAGADSTIYPVLDLEVDSFGAYGNRIGLTLSAPTVDTLPPADATLANSVKAAMYRFQIVERPVDASTPNIVTSMFGETAIDLSLKSGLVNPRVGSQISASDVLIDRYRNIDTPGFPPEYGPFGKLHVYEAIIEELLTELAIGRPVNDISGEGLSVAGAAAYTVALAADATITPWTWWQGLTRTERSTFIGPDTAIGAEAGWNSDIVTAVGDYVSVEADITQHHTLSDLSNIHLLNFISGKDVKGVEYRNLQLNGPDADDNSGILMSNKARHYAAGGSDGDISIGNFDTLTGNQLENWGDLEATLLDRAKYPQSIIYDSGFSLETKQKMLTPIGLRKDVAVILSTQELGYWDRAIPLAPVWVVKGPNTAVEESNMAIALKGAAELYPESEVYGTSVCRAAVIGHAGHLINSQYKGWLPLTIDVADKLAGYMGAGIGTWSAGQAPDIAPNNQVSRFKDVNVPYKNDVVYDNDWDSGLVWVQHFDRQNLFYPAWQTVYSDDTSVLNSMITMLACVELEKVADRVWRELTGRSDLTNEQFIERSDALIEANTRDRFDGRFIIVPETYFTEADEIRGYSWSTNIKIYANNMKTVGSMTIEAWRQSDFGQ